MNRKFRLMWRVGLALVLVLSLSLVMAVPVSAASAVSIDSPTELAPVYKQPGQMVTVQFDITTTGTDEVVTVKIEKAGLVIGSVEKEVTGAPGAFSDVTADVTLALAAPDRAYDVSVYSEVAPGVDDTELDAVIVDNTSPADVDIISPTEVSPFLIGADMGIPVTFKYTEANPDHVDITIGGVTYPEDLTGQGGTVEWTTAIPKETVDMMTPGVSDVVVSVVDKVGLAAQDTETEAVTIDLIAPDLVSAKTISTNAASVIELTFDEALNPDSVAPSDFAIDGTAVDGLGDSAVVADAIVTLTYNDVALILGTGDTPVVTIAAGRTVSDLAGNLGDAGNPTAADWISPINPQSTSFGPINSGNAASVNVDVVFAKPPEGGTVTVRLTDEEAATAEGTVTEGADYFGSDTVTVTVDASTLADGTITATAKIVDDGQTLMNPAGFTASSTATKDTEGPAIESVEGQVNSNTLVVTFTEGVYADDDATGALEPADFTLTDNDDSRSIHSVTHTAGSDTAILTLYNSAGTAPLALDFTTDIGTDTLQPAATTAMYDAVGNEADVTPEIVNDTVTPPAPTSVVITTDPIIPTNETAVAVTVTFDTPPEPGNLKVQLFDEELNSTDIAETDNTIFTDTPTVVEFGIDCGDLDDGIITAEAWLVDGGANESDVTTGTATKDTFVAFESISPTGVIYISNPTITVVYAEVVTIDAATLTVDTTETNLVPTMSTSDNQTFYFTTSGLAAGAYTVEVTATDVYGNSATDSAVFNVATEYSIGLPPALNLISLPLIPVSTAIADVLPATGVEHVWYYDASEPDPALRWLVYHPANIAGSNLFTMQDGKAYWIEMSSPQTMTLTGTVYPAGAIEPPVYSVFEGWNMVGFKSVVNMEAQPYFSPSEAETWASYSPVVGWTMMQENLIPGEGYWVYFMLAGFIVP